MDRHNGNQILLIQIQFGNIQFNKNYDSTNDTNGVLCAQFKILKYPKMEIYEDEFCNSCAVGPADFSQGKSILMTLKNKEVEKLQNEFKITVQIIRTRIEVDLIPRLEQVAHTSIDIANFFNHFLSSFNGSPIVRVIKDQLELIDPDSGVVIGTICVFLQLKSFGNYIMSPLDSILKTEEQKVKSCRKLIRRKTPKQKDTKEELGVDGNDFSEIGAENSNEALKVRVYKPSQLVAKTKVEAPNLEPGSLFVGKEQVLFSMDKTKTTVPKSKTNFDIKPGTGAKQTIELVPKTNTADADKLNILSGEGPNANFDTYLIVIGKTNYKKNLSSKIEMEVKVPRIMKEKKERLSKDVQYAETDVVPAAVGKKKKK